MRNKEDLFPGIIGYDQTVVPALVNAILAKHDIILLGLRGQAKSRIVRQLDHPSRRVRSRSSKGARSTTTRSSRSASSRSTWSASAATRRPSNGSTAARRYGEKLATPDVTIADLIGDIDPIKAAAQRLHYAHEGAIHFGIIPRCNRGIFAINELPDLQPRIQVGLFNILEEKDIQIRGFNVRIPLDIMLVFTANPEDYTNRGQHHHAAEGPDRFPDPHALSALAR